MEQMYCVQIYKCKTSTPMIVTLDITPKINKLSNYHRKQGGRDENTKALKTISSVRSFL